MKLCIVVPHFNHTLALEAFLPRLAALNLPCFIVDDGSSDNAKTKLLELLSAHPTIELVEHLTNRGKGAAMWSGAHIARQYGFTHMLQIDADGQHDTADSG